MNLYGRDRLIFSLDISTIEEVEKWLNLLRGHVKVYKVGKQLFVRNGPYIVNMIKDSGGEVFLDLKFHDIPNTVAEASRVATNLGVRMFNVHALGGFEMMRAAKIAVDEAVKENGLERPLVLGVTILTSLGEEELKSIGIHKSVTEEALLLSRLAKEAGLDGVIASPHEVRRIKDTLGKDFIVVTPGIRPARTYKNDQTRIATPAYAMGEGSDYIVVGRPIKEANNPVAMVDDIIKEMEDSICQG